MPEDKWTLPPDGGHMDRATGIYFQNMTGKEVEERLKKCDLIILPIGSTVETFEGKVHQDFAEKMKSARVWGDSASFEGQTISREHILQDGDIVELNM